MKFIVCGVEHSGTTLISDLFRQVPGLDSGFEVGVLLKDTPSEFYDLQPFSKNMLAGWGITEEDLRRCCEQADYTSFYDHLQKVAGELESDTRRIFDKTPRYLSELSSCLDKTNCPFIITYKDPRATVYSDFKRSKSKDFFDWYVTYKPTKLQYMKKCYNEYYANKDNKRAYFVSLEELALNARATMEAMFSHVGENFMLDYIVMKDLRYKNTHSTSVSIPIAFSFKNELDKNIRRTIEKDFDAVGDWFYD